MGSSQQKFNFDELQEEIVLFIVVFKVNHAPLFAHNCFYSTLFADPSFNRHLLSQHVNDN